MVIFHSHVSLPHCAPHLSDELYALFSYFVYDMMALFCVIHHALLRQSRLNCSLKFHSKVGVSFLVGVYLSTIPHWNWPLGWNILGSMTRNRWGWKKNCKKVRPWRRSQASSIGQVLATETTARTQFSVFSSPKLRGSVRMFMAWGQRW